ncbi:hypothetical protein Tco_0763641 [Tanacetum coccineum]
MTTAAAQQVTLDNTLAPPEERVENGKCNMRINPTKTQKEPTYQVVLDALALTTCYPAFLITADVPKIYMRQFWFTINKKDSTSYRLKIDKKEFDALPSNEEIISFIKELGHKGDIKSVTDIVDDNILGPMRFVSKADDYQMYGALLPEVMTNQKMQASPAYKTYLALATGAVTPKKARKFKKHASPSKKKTLIIIEEPEPAKRVKKAPATTDRSKGIDLLSEAALFEEVQVPDEPKGKSVDTHEGTDLKPGVLNVSKADSSESEYES